MAVVGTSARVAMLIMAVVAVMTLVSPAHAATGTATYYGPPYTPSACYGNQNMGDMVAAASDTLWNNGAACGKKYTVKCTGATNQGGAACRPNTEVVVKIVDYCPPGCQGTIDLSEAAFDTIAELGAGKIKISYTPA